MPGYDHLYGSSYSHTGTSPGAVGGYTPPSGGNSNNNNNNNNNNYYSSNVDKDQGFTADPVNTSTWEDAYNSMGDSGQWGGGIGGGVSNRTPVQYPTWMYTDEGLEELKLHGWSDQLKPEYAHDGKFSVLNPNWKIEGKPWEEWARENDQMGQDRLGYGVTYSPWANNGKGGFIYEDGLNAQNDQGSTGGRSWGPGWGGSWGGFGGSRGIGNYGRYANWHKKNYYADSPIAQQLAYNRANQASPQNQWMFTQMLQSMPGGGITNAV